MKKLGRLGKHGFSMIELLVVLLIVGILAAVAAPLFLANAERARVSEAVSTMGQIRSAEREFFTRYTIFYPVAGAGAGAGAIPAPAGSIEFTQTPPVGGAATAGLGVNADPAQFFSMTSFTVVAGAGAAFADGAAAANFVITANGALSAPIAIGAAGSTGARNPGPVATYVVQMDNSGRTIFSVTGFAGPWRSFT